MQTARLFLTLAGLIAVSACTPKQVCQNLYEGIRVRNQLQTPPPVMAGKPEAPAYQQYEVLRNERRNPTATTADKR